MSVISANPWATAFTIADTGYPEYPVAGSSQGDKFFYAVKVDTGLLIADRPVHSAISWNALNISGLIDGIPLTSPDLVGLNVRVISGGICYADASGNKSLRYTGAGAWPTNNEWDTYIIKFDSTLIKPGYTSNDVFHQNDSYCWCQETPAAGTWTDNNGNTDPTALGDRISRGMNVTGNWRDVNNTASSYASWAFRPIFEYKEG